MLKFCQLSIFFMFDKINQIIAEKNLGAKDCKYHTLRTLENNGKIRCLVIKGDDKVHVDLICPKCGTYSYIEQDWKPVSKAAKIRFRVECPKCGTTIKVEKLKGKKKKKKK